MLTWIFLGFLLTAAGQDLFRKQVKLWVYLLFALLAVGAGLWQWCLSGVPYDIGVHAVSCILGALLLGLSWLSRGAVGQGDGLFFLVSGLMLAVWENLALLCYGTLLCGLFSLGYFTWGKLKGNPQAGKLTVPFLPFVAVPGLWLVGLQLWEL